MSRKGISPLIAAVLLIAFTMAVASLFAQWAPQLIKNAQGDTANKSSQIQECVSVNVEVMDANASYISLRQTDGDRAVGNMSATWTYNGSEIETNYGAITTPTGNTEIWSSLGPAAELNQIDVNPLNCEGAPSKTYKP